VAHHRFSPQVHGFAYRIFLFAVDLDELPLLHRKFSLFSLNHRNLYSFRDADFLPTGSPVHNGDEVGQAMRDKTLGLKARVVAYVARQGVDLEGGRVVLVTLPRILGYLFNPVSFYFCYDRSGEPVAALAEVTNTFREMKPYFLGPEAREGLAFHRLAPKHFYVSPFSDVDVAFDFQLKVPGDGLSVQIDDYSDGRRTLTSTLQGSRRELTGRRLAWFALKYPLLSLRIIALIHAHAAVLWLKRVPSYAKAARPGHQRNLYRPHVSIAREQ